MFQLFVDLFDVLVRLLNSLPNLIFALHVHDVEIFFLIEILKRAQRQFEERYLGFKFEILLDQTLDLIVLVIILLPDFHILLASQLGILLFSLNFLLEGRYELICVRPIRFKLLGHLLLLLNLDKQSGIKLVTLLFSLLKHPGLLLKDADFIILLIKHYILFSVALDLHLVDSRLQLIHLFDQVLLCLKFLINFVLKHEYSHVIFTLKVLTTFEIFFTFPFKSVDLVLEIGEIFVIDVFIFCVFLQFKTTGLKIFELVILLVDELRFF